MTDTALDLPVMTVRLFVDGEFRDGSPGAVSDINPAAEKVITDVSEAGPDDVDAAVQAAQPRMLNIPDAVATLWYFAGWADKINGSVISTPGYFGRPTHSYTALASGNTIVAKQPEDAPLSILHLAGLIAEAGIPAGAVNVLPGLGEVTGDALVSHPGVDKISFTGSTEVGRRVGALAAQRFARTTLELGGKTPQIILADADVEAAIGGTAMGLFFNQGEVCVAGTRVLVHRSLYDTVVAAPASAADAQVVGDPSDPGHHHRCPDQRPPARAGPFLHRRGHRRRRAYGRGW